MQHQENMREQERVVPGVAPVNEKPEDEKTGGSASVRQEQPNAEPAEQKADENATGADRVPEQQAHGSGTAAIEPSPSEQLAQAETKAAEMQDAFLRAKAEVENLRRRTQEEISRTYKFAIENFAEALVPVKDSLETALQVEASSVDALREGVDMTLKQLTNAFEKNRLIEINPHPGDKLDPMRHQAISMVPAEQTANTIVTVLQKGYTLADRLLRPALVTVAQEQAPPKEK